MPSSRETNVRTTKCPWLDTHSSTWPSLMHRLGLVGELDDLVGLGESLVDVAHLVLDALGDVGGLRRRGIDAARDHVLEQQRRIGLHRLVDVDDVRQDFVVDFDQLQRLFRDRRRRRGDRRDRMAFVEHLLARHDVARHVPEVDCDALGPHVLELVVGQVLRRHHGLHALQRLGLRGVDAADARVRMRRAQDLAPQHARKAEVRAVLGEACDLRHAIRAHRIRADDLELFLGMDWNVLRHAGHDQAPRISAAVSSTASMIF
jgi:hypothetical protein